MPRFFQGYFYPSYTGGVVTTFRSAEAEKGWETFKALWAVTNPNSTNYDFMQEPLLAGDVWIALDHVARVKDALDAQPDEFVAFPAPAGSEGPRLHAGGRRPRHSPRARPTAPAASR